jgi:hypothetical protein
MRDLKAEHEDLREKFEDNQAQFVMTELETSITFCQLAMSTSDPERMERNIRNAFTGYRTALHFWQTSDYDLGASPMFRERLDRLKALLHQLGKDV